MLTFVQFMDFNSIPVDQLMELAGLSCAHALAKEFKLDDDNGNNKVLIIAGPGNNGGDGLVCARHLSLMKFEPCIYYPKPTDKPLFNNLVHQCKLMGINFIDDCPSEEIVAGHRVIVDGLFGFSFKPPVRESFQGIMDVLLKTKVPIVSIDIPSGWNVELGNSSGSADFIRPSMLVSLTAPKQCAKYFKGTHYIGGRFVPKALEEKYALDLPTYPGTETCLKIS